MYKTHFLSNDPAKIAELKNIQISLTSLRILVEKHILAGTLICVNVI